MLFEILGLLLVLYIINISPGLNEEFENVFTNPVIQLLLLIVLIYSIFKNQTLAILILIAITLTHCMCWILK